MSAAAPSPLISVCAWCFPNDRRPNVSHGICPRHRAQMVADLEKRILQEYHATTNETLPGSSATDARKTTAANAQP